MEDLKDFFEFLLGFAAVVGCFYLYLRFASFLYERGWTSRYSWQRGLSKVEIQTLFHGNTKDDNDQL